MTLEIVEESDVRKAEDKEKKSGLQLLRESDIKKVGNEKKSWLDIVDKPDVREDPKIELVDKSDTRKVGGKVKKPGVEFIAKERIVNCERNRSGMTNNCVLCKELNNDIFSRCSNRYRSF
jgi:hypothetical protein